MPWKGSTFRAEESWVLSSGFVRICHRAVAVLASDNRFGMEGLEAFAYYNFDDMRIAGGDIRATVAIFALTPSCFIHSKGMDEREGF